MKLHHFTPKDTEKSHLQGVGKALAGPKITPVTAPAVVESTVVEAKKKSPDGEVTNKVQAHRDFAEQQLEKTSPLHHRKIRNFD